MKMDNDFQTTSSSGKTGRGMDSANIGKGSSANNNREMKQAFSDLASAMFSEPKDMSDFVAAFKQLFGTTPTQHTLRQVFELTLEEAREAKGRYGNCPQASKLTAPAYIALPPRLLEVLSTLLSELHATFRDSNRLNQRDAEETIRHHARANEVLERKNKLLKREIGALLERSAIFRARVRQLTTEKQALEGEIARLKMHR